MCLATL